MAVKGDAAMFAPPIKATKSKSDSHAAPVRAPNAPRHMFNQPRLGAAEQMLMLTVQRIIGNQAESLTGDKSDDYPTQEVNPAQVAGWDFSRVPIFAPGRTNRPQPSPLLIQPKLMVGQVNDPLEQEADRVADQVLRMPALTQSITPGQPQLSRKCACGGRCFNCQTAKLDQEHEHLQTKHVGSNDLGQTTAPPIVYDVLRSPGQSLDPKTRAFMESRFSHDFSSVRVHSDEKAANSAHVLNALAYTFGRNVVFGQGQFSPNTLKGRQLLAHELTHVVQQEASASSATIVQRQIDPMQQKVDDMDLAAEREYGDSGAPKAQTCGRPSRCPPGFCSPYRSEKLAEYYRAKNGPILLAGISAAVDSRVVPFWKEYLWGGSAPKNITADFSKDFTNSPTTRKATIFLNDELKKSLAAKPPLMAPFSSASINIATLISGAIGALNNPSSTDRMNFSMPRDIPGNLAGDIGIDQISCPAGAKPSPFNDERHASGTVGLERNAGPDITVTPSIIYSVQDTVDLCPGDCGLILERVATVPLSQFEATGISGDVPFTVEFPAPSLGSFTISSPLTVSAPLPTSPAPAPAPKKPTK
jgi:hypothetical protein